MTLEYPTSDMVLVKRSKVWVTHSLTGSQSAKALKAIEWPA